MDQEQTNNPRDASMEADFEELVRYAKAAAPCLRSEVEEQREERTVIFADSGAWVTVVEMPGVSRYVYGTVAHDPGVRYHADGSGTPPSDDPVELGETEDVVDAVRSVVQHHLLEDLNDRLESESEALRYEEMERLDGEG